MAWRQERQIRASDNEVGAEISVPAVTHEEKVLCVTPSGTEDSTIHENHRSFTGRRRHDARHVDLLRHLDPVVRS